MFTQHRDSDQSWPEYLADYDLTEVIEARPESDTDNDLRTLVYRATPKGNVEPVVAIKVVPLGTRAKTMWAYTEMRIHYALSQMDASSIRAADDTDNALFRADKADKLQYDQSVSDAILAGKSWNVVPLYDFATRLAVLKKPASFEKMDKVVLPRPTTSAAFLTQKYFEKTLDKHARSLALAQRVVLFRDALAHLSAVLHQLMAIEFTHGDLKAENIAYIEMEAGTKQRLYHQLAPDKWVVLQDQTGFFAMFDFGFSRARFSDATSNTWRLVPNSEMLEYRFGAGRGSKITVEQTFAPVVDLYRLVESICRSLALHVRSANGDTAGISDSSAGERLQAMILVVLKNTTQEFMDIKFQTLMIKFAENMRSADSSAANSSAVNLIALWNSRDWSKLHTTLPDKQEDIMKLALPWDVLSQLPAEMLTDKKPATGVDMTFKPLTKAGKRYLGTQFINDPQFRLAPLK